jgi:hypothetical protein
MNVYVVMSHYDLDYSGVDRIEAICLTEEIAKQKQAKLELIQKAKQNMFQRNYWIEDFELDVGDLTVLQQPNFVIIS